MTQQFQQYLQDNAGLQESSKSVYLKAVNELVNTTGNNPTIEQLNHFIAVKCQKRQPHVKYAIKEYLKFLGREADYLNLTRAKVRETIKEKVFLTKEQMRMVINSIENPMHKCIALVQYNTAARASEILTVRKHRITKEKYIDILKNEKERVKIRIKGKGDKIRNIYLLPDFWPLLEPYYNECRDYLFLNDKHNPITYFGLWGRVETLYRKYYESLRVAANKCGFKIGTHDLRRSFADDLLRTGKDIYKVQKVLGHKSIDTTVKYLRPNNEQVAESMLDHQEDYLG